MSAPHLGAKRLALQLGLTLQYFGREIAELALIGGSGFLVAFFAGINLYPHEIEPE